MLELFCILSSQASQPRGAISLEISSCTQPIIDGRVPPTLYFNTKTQMQAAIQTSRQVLKSVWEEQLQRDSNGRFLDKGGKTEASTGKQR